MFFYQESETRNLNHDTSGTVVNNFGTLSEDFVTKTEEVPLTSKVEVKPLDSSHDEMTGGLKTPINKNSN